MLISTYAWKGLSIFIYYFCINLKLHPIICYFINRNDLGIWDMFDATAELFKSSKTLYSCFITGSVGFILFIFLIVFERLVQKSKLINKNGKIFKILSELNLFLAYISITAVWRTYWSVC
jgi:hypothetical protein